MASFYDYTHATGSNVDVSARVRAYRTELRSNAEEGSVAISTLIIDDPEGGLDIKGLRPFTWSETAESSNSAIIYKGYTADRDISRGPFRNGTGRIWTVNVTDQNAIINRRIMRGADANRPAETDVARVQWLMTTGEFGLVVVDSTYISTASPVAMDAVDYRNQRCQDILDDCAQQSGKNFFIILNELSSPPPYALFYDFAGSTAYPSSIRLTNVLADVDNPVTNTSTTFAVIDDRTKVNRDPSRVYSGIILPFDGGEVFVYDPAIASAFHPRDTMAPSVNVKTAAKATTRANRYLADAATEADIIDFAFLVPLAKVNRLKEGMTFQIKLSHAPGYTDWTWVRCLNRTVIATSEEYYTVVGQASPGAATAGPAAACSTVVAALQTYNSGNVAVSCWNWAAGALLNAVTITTPAPSIVVTAFGMVQCSFAPSGVTSAANYTLLSGADTLQAGGAAWRAVNGAAPSLGVNFTVGDVNGRGLVAIGFPTGATSPVQGANQIGSGGTVTFGSTPTVGNLLVCSKVIQQNDDTAMVADTGWTLITSRIIQASPGITRVNVGIQVRCVQTGDDTTFEVAGGAFYHSNYVTEWALT